ncbi:TauD/TfdA family dioxygenase [Sphingobium sp. EM0848]|uniref:TauD/TfdA dioxygenase family protein n=1 Tax=Sphingobium sp. EM0848 TaxID=2743473 RepID=UPI002101BD17|nr:TauD/TfdA family dioxygenase [Sphingobium sp. EM0848]
MNKSDMAQADSNYINMPDPTSPLEIEPVAGRIGAVIRGVSLAEKIDDATLAAIRTALARHKVIFFRDQHLDDQQHAALVARLGRAGFDAPGAAAEEARLIELNSSDGYAADIWHTDQTYVESPPDVTTLRAIVMPEAGGDTMWANTATAYADLPAPLKALADGLRGIHTNVFDYTQASGKAKDKEDWLQTVRPVRMEAEHPVVRVHPETGERALILGAYLQRFAGFNGSDSRHIAAVLQDHITRPENTVRWGWRVGDVALWDNRATQHRAIVDFGSQLRVVKRATLPGSTPVGVDGRPGRTIPQPPV